jgi:hypothetical protein
MKKVFIDPGHGGEDNGAAWGERYDYLEEDDLNLIISFRRARGHLGHDKGQVPADHPVMRKLFSSFKIAPLTVKYSTSSKEESRGEARQELLVSNF